MATTKDVKTKMLSIMMAILTELEGESDIEKAAGKLTLIERLVSAHNGFCDAFDADDEEENDGEEE